MRWPRPLSLLFLLLIFLGSIPSSWAYERIVSLKPNLTEILFALGVGDKIVGVTSFCDFPAEARKIDKVSDYIQPDLEKLLSKNPDLILTSEENSSRREIEFLMRKGYKVLTYPSNTLKELRASIWGLGDILGKKERAEKIVGDMDRSLGQLRERAQKVKAPRALFVVGHQPLIVAGSRNLFNDVAPYLGVINAAGESRFLYPTFSLEMFLAKAPEMVLDFAMGSEDSLRGREERRRWWSQYSKVPAVRDGKVLLLDMSRIRATPRLPGELEKLFEVIHSPFGSAGKSFFFHLSVLGLTPAQARPHRSMIRKGVKEMDRYEAVQEK